MLKPLILLVTISTGALIGWYCGTAGGIIGAYFTAVFGASIGLFIGRRIQRNMGDD